METVECSNAIRRIRVVATLQIILWHCLCPFIATAWAWFDSTYIDAIAPKLFGFAFGDVMLPTFFIMSGLLFGYKSDLLGGVSNCKSVCCQIVKRFDRLMVPYALFYTLYNMVLKNYFDCGMTLAHLWFLPTLFICFLVAAVTLKVNRWTMVLMAFPLIFLSGRFQDVGLYFVTLSFPMNYLFYFLLGMAMYKHYGKVKAMPKWQLLAIAIMYFSCVVMPVPVGRKTLCALLFNLLLFSLVSNKDFGNGLIDKAVLLIDKCSFGMYVLHQILIVSLLQVPSLRAFYSTDPAIWVPVMFMMAALASLAVTYGLRTFGFKWI